MLRLESNGEVRVCVCDCKSESPMFSDPCFIRRQQQQRNSCCQQALLSSSLHLFKAGEVFTVEDAMMRYTLASQEDG